MTSNLKVEPISSDDVKHEDPLADFTPQRLQIFLKYVRINPSFLRDPASFPHTLKLIASDLAGTDLRLSPPEVLNALETWKQRTGLADVATLLRPPDRELHRLLTALDTRLTHAQITLVLQHLEVVGSASDTLWPTIAVEMRALKVPPRPEVYWRKGFEEWGQEARRAFREDPDGLTALQQRYVEFLQERDELDGPEGDGPGVDALELVINHCRACLEVLKLGSRKVYLFEALGTGTTMADKINVCFGSGINVEERLPKYVCERCVEQVEAAYGLKMQIDRTDEELRSLIAEYDSKPADVVEETVPVEEVIEEQTESAVGVEQIPLTVDGTVEVTPIEEHPLEEESLDLGSGVELDLENEEIIAEEHDDFIVANEEDAVVEVEEKHERYTIHVVDMDTTEEPSETTDESGKVCSKIDPAAENNFFQCEKCRVVLRTHALWQTHKARHDLERHFACAHCSKKFRSASTLKVHQRTHTNERPYVCDICNKSFAQNTNLVYHRKVHQDIRDFACDQCSYRARNQNDLNLHRRRHSGARPYTCDICQLSFSTSSNLSKHVKRRHMGERNYKVCGKGFRTLSQVKTHGYVHEPLLRPVKCEHCPYRTSTKSSLAIHQKSHAAAKPYVCPVCGAGFSICSNMHKHVRNMHEKRRAFKCDHCDKTFTTKETAQKHLVTHTGTKPYPCPECSVAYGWYNGLQKHMKAVHSGVPIPTEKSMIVRHNEEQRAVAEALGGQQ